MVNLIAPRTLKRQTHHPLCLQYIVRKRVDSTAIPRQMEHIFIGFVFFFSCCYISFPTPPAPMFVPPDASLCLSVCVFDTFASVSLPLLMELIVYLLIHLIYYHYHSYKNMFAGVGVSLLLERFAPCIIHHSHPFLGCQQQWCEMQCMQRVESIANAPIQYSLTGFCNNSVHYKCVPLAVCSLLHTTRNVLPVRSRPNASASTSRHAYCQLIIGVELLRKVTRPTYTVHRRSWFRVAETPHQSLE